MGIQGLLPFLSNSTRDAHISDFEYEFVAIDAYCWLHKGVYSCCVEVAMKKPTTKYVTYCMRYVEMLLHFKVKPILVFDGKKLSSKQETEKKRREERKNKYNKGLELIRAGKTAEGRKLLGESVDVTHDLAVNLMKECRKHNVDCIVAPYEADSQLAYFSLNNIVKCVITEDSDLLVYGCERVMFKMDTSGKGKVVEKSKLHLSLGINPEEFSEDKFRYMCILSGCDYLPSLPSIGPANALKFIKLLNEKNIYETLPKLPLFLNKLKVTVTQEYINGFKVADNTFKHQIVYDPFLRKELPLLPVSNEDDVVGEKLEENLAFQLAVGNIDPITMKKMDDFNPDECGKGFSLLWTTEFLPHAVVRPNRFNSTPHSVEKKKRQREVPEFDFAPSFKDGLKKQCLFQNASFAKNNCKKENINQVSNTGFIFKPKLEEKKKNNVKPLDKSKLLGSRYFVSKKSEPQEKEKEKDQVFVRLKGEFYEEYLQRLCDEHLTGKDDVLKDEESFEKYCCDRQAEMTKSVMEKNCCESCTKCSKCCRCKISNEKLLNQCLKDIEEYKLKQSYEDNDDLVDEIYKEEKKNDKEESRNSPKENEEVNNKRNNNEESLVEVFNLYLSDVSRVSESSVNKESESIEINLEVEKENENREKDSDLVIDSDVEPIKRTPSPVFIVRRESKILHSNSKLANVSDTVATPTSVYFSPSNSKNLQRSASLVSYVHTPSISTRKTSSIGVFHSVPSKRGRSVSKNSKVHRTLFEFGFKKRQKHETEKEAG